MTTDLDPRREDAARRALTRLLDAVDVGPAPATPRAADPADLDAATPAVLDLGALRDPASAPPHSRRRLVVGIAAAVAFVLGIGLAVALQGTGDDAGTPPGRHPDPAPVEVGDVPHLEPDSLPDGTERLYGSELPLAPDQLDPGSADVTAYGRPGAEDPFADGDLAVIVVEDETVGLAGSDATVRGGPGRIGDTTEADDLGLSVMEEGPFRWVSWREADDVEVTLASHTLGIEDLAALAETTEVDGTSVQVVDRPDGLEAVGTLEGLTFGGPAFVPGTAAGWYDVYGTTAPGSLVPADDTPRLQVATFAGTEEELLVARWMVDADPNPVPVRGGEGWVSVLAGDDELTVLWEEAPGVLAVAQASAELQGLVGGLQAAG